jgi:uncharacterized protein
MAEKKNNPFRYSGDLGAKELVDRAEETAAVEATIRNGEKLFLIGPRRFGKTSILRAAEERLTEEGAIVLRLNAEAYPTVEMLVEKIVSLAATRLKDKAGLAKAGLALEQIARLFARLRPEIRYSGVEQEFSVSLGLDSSVQESHPVKALADALDGLEKMALEQPAGRPVGLILDEFQAVVARGGPKNSIDAEAQIRSAIQEHHRVGYVFSGSETRLMTEMTMNHDRPLYRLGANRFIGPLPAREFAAHIEKQFRKSGFTIAGREHGANPVERILALAEEVPYNVQMLAHNCWEELRERSRKKPAELTAALVEQVLERTVQGLDPLFTQQWTRLTAVQQKALLALVRREGTGMSSSEAARSMNLAVASLQSALRGLHEQNILRDEAAEGHVRTRFEDPFFGHWIRMTVG